LNSGDWSNDADPGAIAFDGDVVAFSEHAVRIKAAAAAKAYVLRRNPKGLLDICQSPARMVALTGSSERKQGRRNGAAVRSGLVRPPLDRRR
jgi:hypothetical protein